MAISGTKSQGWRSIPTQYRKASDILTSTLAVFYSAATQKGKGIENVWFAVQHCLLIRGIDSISIQHWLQSSLHTNWLLLHRTITQWSNNAQFSQLTKYEKCCS